MARPTLAASLCLALGAAAAGALPARADDPAKPGSTPAKPATPPPAPGKPEDPVVLLVARLASSQPLEVRLAAVREAAAVEDARLVAPLVHLLHDEDVTVRAAAVAALGTRTDTPDKKRAATALVERLEPLDKASAAKAEAKQELVATIKALHDLAQEVSIQPLLKGIDEAEDADLVEARAMAVGNVPAAAAIEALIDWMARGRRDGSGVRSRLAKALAYATGEPPVNDPDHWRAWWKDHKATFDFIAAAERRAQAAKESREKGKKKKGT